MPYIIQYSIYIIYHRCSNTCTVQTADPPSLVVLEAARAHTRHTHLEPSATWRHMDGWDTLAMGITLW